MGFSSLLASLPSTPLSGLFGPSLSSSSAGGPSPKGKLRLVEDEILDEVDLVAGSGTGLGEDVGAVKRVEVRIEGM